LSAARAPLPRVHPGGNRIRGAIESAISAGATVHEHGPWSASVFMRYFGPLPLIEDNSVRSVSSTIFNAQVSHRVNPKTRLAPGFQGTSPEGTNRIYMFLLRQIVAGVKMSL
jgi:hypothetical protein